MKIVTIVGARPQFVKVAPVSAAFRANPAVEEVLLHTGQHYDEIMSDVFFRELGIPKPNYNLGVGSGAHAVQTARMMEAVNGVLDTEDPDLVLVYGDTNSTLAGALVAAKRHVPVAHIEAGLRSHNRKMPEELNRIVTDHLSDYLFAPTRLSVENLHREGLADRSIHMVGDVMYDVALSSARRAPSRAHTLVELGLQGQYVLATIHRAENTDDPTAMDAIVRAMNELSNEIDIVFPVHPRTRAAIERLDLLDRIGPGVHLRAPVGYLEMVALERDAALIITDSGGVQKEAYFFGVPCVTLRAETEWVELVELGWNTLTPPAIGAKGIVEQLRRVLKQARLDAGAAKPYGNGDSAKLIARIIANAVD